MKPACLSEQDTDFSPQASVLAVNAGEASELVLVVGKERKVRA